MAYVNPQTSKLVINGTSNGHSNGLSKTGLDVVVIGAGIAGLTAAVGLRQQGHSVVVLEQSDLADQDGAAIDCYPPNTGVLRRFGLHAEQFGGNVVNGVTEYNSAGHLKSCHDASATAKLWQHPHLIVGRGDLFKALIKQAVGLGTEVRTSSRIISIDPAAGSVTLDNDEKIHADLIVGADGVRSTARTFVPGNSDIQPTESGKNAFFTTFRREKIDSDSELTQYIDKDSHKIFIVGQDRQINIYPIQGKASFHIVGIHPAAESGPFSDDWRTPAKKSNLVESYKSFAPHIQKLLSLTDDSTLRVWPLLDMKNVPQWSHERLVLVGDAVRSYGVQRAVGSGQAIDDVGSLVSLLNSRITPSEVPEVLRFYQEARKPRADHTREMVRDQLDQDNGSAEKVDMEELEHALSGYDAWDATRHALDKHFIKHNRTNWIRAPIGLGLQASLRQTAYGPLHKPQNHSLWVRHMIRFRTSRTVLDRLLPEGFSFRAPGTVAEATWMFGNSDRMDWLGGGGYHYITLLFHGVDYTKKDGSKIHGAYLLFMIEDSCDGILGGILDSGMAKLYADTIAYRRIDDTILLEASWRGVRFLEMKMSGLHAPPSSSAAAAPKIPTATAPASSSSPSVTTPTTQTSPPPAPSPPPPAETGLMYERYVAAVGQPGIADAQYPVICPFTGGSGAETKVTNIETATDATITYYPEDSLRLPTWNTLVERLAEIPFLGLVSATVVSETGADDNRNAVRIE